MDKKQEIRQQHNLQDYILRVEQKTEPELHIIGPAIEASKYYIDSEELREMFANLIAATVDTRQSNISHLSFVEIIKQLSPLDASNLTVFKKEITLSIVNYRLEYSNGSGGVDIKTDVFLSNPSQNNIDLQATSISNLSRLGLVLLKYDSHLFKDDFYKDFNQNSFFLDYKKILTSEDLKKLAEV